MNAIEGFPFFEEETSAKVSDVFVSHVYTDASIEVKGDASFTIEVQGCIDRNKEREIEWTTLCVVDESNFDTLTSITKPGIYSFSAMGKGIRVEIKNISGGKVTVVGKFLN